MPKIPTRLSHTQVAKAKPLIGKEYLLADGDGLYLRVKANGLKVWLFNYRKPHTKKRSNLRLGSFPDMSLEKARTKTSEFRNLVSQGIDPKNQRESESSKQAKAHINTLKYVTEQWFDIKKHEVTPDYADDIYSSLVNHVFPKLGNVPIHLINAPETIAALNPLDKAGKQEMVKRICQRLNMIMNHAVNGGIVATNPLAGIKTQFKTPERTNFPTLKPEQLPMLMQTINGASVTFTTRCLIEWQLHTMVRPSEAAGAMWNEIDIDNKEWTIPKERMKKRRSHTIPLTSQCLSILEKMRPFTAHREFVFASPNKPRQPVSSETVNMALKRMGLKGQIVSHGFRSLASTTLNEQAFDADLIEVALAHQDKNAVRAAYNRADYLERRMVMMQWWSDHIEEAQKGKADLPSSIKHLRVAASGGVKK